MVPISSVEGISLKLGLNLSVGIPVFVPLSIVTGLDGWVVFLFTDNKSVNFCNKTSWPLLSCDADKNGCGVAPLPPLPPLVETLTLTFCLTDLSFVDFTLLIDLLDFLDFFTFLEVFLSI